MLYWHTLTSGRAWQAAQTVWRDPVWSKVIASGILSIVSAATFSLSVWIALLLFSSVLILFTCMFVLLSKHEVTLIKLNRSLEHRNRPDRFSLRVRRSAGLGIMSMAVGIWNAFMRPGSPATFPVLVTRIEGTEEQNYRLTDIIADGLRENTRKYSDIAVRAWGRDAT